VQKLPAYPPVVCVAPDWKTESCDNRSEPKKPIGWRCGDVIIDFSTKKSFSESYVPDIWTFKFKGLKDPNPEFVWGPKDELTLNGRACVLRYAEETIIQDDFGGVINEYVDRWRRLAAQGGEVKVLGKCSSACTLITAYIPKNRLCFGQNASLSFHQARNPETNSPSLNVTTWMIRSYPDDIRNWLLAHGGIEKMPQLNSFWMVHAYELWDMGYRKCSN
jgi:hypothetical protein